MSRKARQNASMPCIMRFFTFILFAITPMFISAQPLKINELMAINQSSISDHNGDWDDWIELYNASPDTLQVAGFFLSDKPDQPFRWQIPGSDTALTKIPPGGYLLIWCDGSPTEGLLHANFKLDGDGECLSLSAPDSTLLDHVCFEQQTPDISWSRITDGGPEWQATYPATPGTNNSSSGQVIPFAQIPFASLPGGFYGDSIVVQLTSNTPNARIYVRFDGENPDDNDYLYQHPLVITTNTTLRARAFADGHYTSPVATYHYFIQSPGTFPTIALSFDPDDFFDSITGIYTNYSTLYDEERPVYMEWFEPDGSPGFAGKLKVELQGIASLANPQKSLLLKSENGSMNYPFFQTPNASGLDRLILRNSGQDWNVTMFRDAFTTDLGQHYRDLQPVLDTLHLQFQAFRPGLVYFNGQFQGIHNVREAINARFLEQHYGAIDPDLIEDYNKVMVGDSTAWMQFLQWLMVQRCVTNADFDSLATRTDMANFTDYAIYQIVTDNMDWPIKNWRRFRERTPNSKWIWLPYDFDLSTGLLTSSGGWNTGFAGQNAFERALDSTFTYFSSPDWSTLPLRRALENQRYRVRFLNRFADLMNTVFRYERVEARLDSFKALYAPEITRHSTRWGGGAWFVPIWEENVEKMAAFWQNRPQYCFQHAVETFPDQTTGTTQVTLAVHPPGAGTLRWSTLQLDSLHLPWTGTYFKGVPIPVRAIAQPGWHFVRWSELAWGTEDSIHVLLPPDAHIVAEFARDSLISDTSEEYLPLITVQPNPSDDFFRIETEQIPDQWFLYDAAGRSVATPAVWTTGAPGQYELRLHHLPDGVYTVVFYFGPTSVAHQLLKKSK